MTMSNSLHEAAGRGLRLHWELDLDYLTIARFAQLVVGAEPRAPRAHVLGHRDG